MSHKFAPAESVAIEDIVAKILTNLHTRFCCCCCCPRICGCTLSSVHWKLQCRRKQCQQMRPPPQFTLLAWSFVHSHSLKPFLFTSFCHSFYTFGFPLVLFQFHFDWHLSLFCFFCTHLHRQMILRVRSLACLKVSLPLFTYFSCCCCLLAGVCFH